MDRNKVEILAPAGSMDCVTAAVRCGADAVYLGLGALNARRVAENFDARKLAEAARYCRERGVRVHLALNTLVYGDELDEARRLLEAACLAGVDAVIVQDLAVARLARLCAPDMKLHASTQMSVHDLEGVLLARALGFSRVVLARELSLEEIRFICAGARDMQIEVFCHGALCMCISGQCTLSSMIGGRSGNRGLCAQPCRLPFSAGRGEEHALSLRDLSLLTPEHIAALTQAGVASLKIEGRMKRPEYVAAAVTAAVCARAGERPDFDTLRGVFSRGGFTDGYLTASRGAELFGVRAKEDVVAAGGVLGPLQALYRAETPRVGLSMELTVRAGEPARLTVRDAHGNETQALGEVPQEARTRPTGEEDARRALQKLGGTCYRLDTLRADIGEGLMLPIAAMSELRRGAVQALSERRAAIPPRRWISTPAPDSAVREAPARSQAPLAYVALGSAEQFSPALAERCACIALYPRALHKLLQRADTAPYLNKLALRQPPACFEPGALRAALQKARDAGIGTLLVSGLSGILPGRELGFELIGDFSLNITNRAALEEYAALGLAGAVASIELSAARIRELHGVLALGVAVYGRLPLMTLRACPLQNALNCSICEKHGQGEGVLRDRQGRRFPISCRGGAARREVSQLFNSEVLYLPDKLDAFGPLAMRWFYCTGESPAEILEILDAYAAGTRADAPDMKGRTRGLYFRKVY